MKKRSCVILTIISFLSFTGNLWADLGISFEAMTGYVMDMGKHEDSRYEVERNLQEWEYDWGTSSVDSDELLVVDFALSIRYDFFKRFFIRGGIETAQYATDANYKVDGPSGSYEMSYEYEYYGFPLIIGINIPLNRGRYNIYTGIGAFYGIYSLEKVEEGYNYELTYYRRIPSDFDDQGIGVTGIIGFNTIIISGLSIQIEFVYRRYEKQMTDQFEETDQFGAFVSYQTVNEFISAPRTSLRLGVSYSI